MTPFETAYNDIAELVHKFDEHQDQFLAPKYQEAHVRAEFLDKFWTALGWDVRHEFQTNPREQEVKIEKSDNVSMRKADYAFYLKPEYQRPVFLVEAKKPSQDIEKPEYYFQTARYGFNTGTSVAVLTDFQGFHIIDCRRKPELVAGIVNATQLFKFSYKDYLDRDKFGEIYWKFSREAVAEGKLKEYWRSLKKPKGAVKQLKLIGDQLQAPDDLFLDDLEEYRRTLASEFKKSNDNMTSEDLTQAAQKVLDRLVFIRFLEDKMIEPDAIIDKFTSASKTQSWKTFIVQSQKLDKTYNGVVFKEHFIDRSSFNAPKDEKFAAIADELSHHRSPYLFSYIPVEILGSIYERFLGKVVVAKGRGIAVEEKPEVRKARGVYYTPKYIVDYIVSYTVGKILNGSSNRSGAVPAPAAPIRSGAVPAPTLSDARSQADEETSEGWGTQPLQGLAPDEISKLRFADIACGSGSFLIAIFDAINNYLEKWYTDHPDEAVSAGCREMQTDDNGRLQYGLSLEQKRSILQSNIFGVDIDSQAVEVAQFSLFLKLLESETIASVQGFISTAATGKKVSSKQLTFHHGLDRKVLPDLSKNIQCGNSLVEYDISDLFPLTDEEEKRIKPFSFQTAFREIMANGGFDAIVGNPPYVRQEGLGSLKQYFELRYKTFQGTADLYTYFIERAMTLLRLGGHFGYIVANKWMRANYGRPLREWLKQQHIQEIVDFGDLPVFTGATTYPCILRMERRNPEPSFTATNVETLAFENLAKYVDENKFSVRIDALNSASWSLSDEVAYETLAKMKAKGVPLGEYVNGRIFYGVKTGLNDAFVIDKATRDKLILEDRKSDEIIKPFLSGRDIKRYGASFPERYLIFARRGINIQAYSAVKNYLEQFKRQLMPKPPGFSGKDWPGRKPGSYKWYELQDTVDYYEEFERPKIMLPDISQRGNFMLDMGGGMYNMNTSYIIGSSDRYLLGVLNSKCVTFYYSNLSPSYQGGYYRFIYQYLIQIPVPLVDSDDVSLGKIKTSIIALVDQMLDTKKRLASATSDTDRERHQNKCEYLDAEIDKLVYALYGLTEEEIKIVEGN